MRSRVYKQGPEAGVEKGRVEVLRRWLARAITEERVADVFAVER